MYVCVCVGYVLENETMDGKKKCDNDLCLSIRENPKKTFDNFQNFVFKQQAFHFFTTRLDKNSIRFFFH